MSKTTDSDDTFDSTVFFNTTGEFYAGQVRNVGAFQLHPDLAQMLLENAGGTHMMTWRRRGEHGGPEDDLRMDPDDIHDDAREIVLRGFGDGFVLIEEEIDPPEEHIRRNIPDEYTLDEVMGSTLYRWTDIEAIPSFVTRMLGAPGNWVITDMALDFEEWFEDLMDVLDEQEERALYGETEFQAGPDATHSVTDLPNTQPKDVLQAGPMELLRWRTLDGEDYRLTMELTEAGHPTLFLHSRYSDEQDWAPVGMFGGNVDEFTNAAGTDRSDS